MSNLSENRIDMVLSPQEDAQMAAAIQTFIDLIPSNTTLTDEQRARFLSIKVANKVFVEDVLSECQTLGTEILPAYLNLQALEKDLTLFKQIEKHENALRNALQRLLDVKKIAGHEAYGQSTRIYNTIKMASEAGIPNAKSAYTKLKNRFNAQKKSGREEETEV